MPTTTHDHAYEAETAALVRARLPRTIAGLLLIFGLGSLLEYLLHPGLGSRIGAAYAMQVALWLAVIWWVGRGTASPAHLLNGLVLAIIAECAVLALYTTVWTERPDLFALALAFLSVGAMVLLQWGGRRQLAIVGGGLLIFLAALAINPQQVTAAIQYNVIACIALGAVSIAGAFLLDRYRRSLFLQTIEYERTTEELRASEERFRLMTENAREVIFRYRLAEPRGIEYVSPAATAATGYAPEEFYGDEDLFRRLLHPDDVELYRAAPQFIDNPGKGVEVRWIRKDGSVYWADIRLVSIRDAAGNLIGVQGISRDINERKELEHALRNAKDAAEAADRAKGDFLAVMSHEIRTPMNAVIGMTGLLLDTELTTEQRDYAHTVRSSGEMLLSIINDILDFSKIEAGKLELELGDFDVRQMVEEALELLASRAQEKGLELAAAVSDDVPVALHGDAGRLRQVLINLVTNAVKFTERGEVVVRVDVEAGTAESVVLRCEVRDTGVGVSTDDTERLFEPFAQADSSTTRRYGGTGLGLAISKRLVEAMGGGIGVRSAPGTGSTFWFTARLAAPAAAVPSSEPDIDLRGLRVLIVDDNATNRTILERLLQSRGVVTDSAASGPEAIERLRAAAGDGTTPHVAVVDLQMPDMDGLQLARAIKADPALADIGLVLLASMIWAGQRATATETGIAATLTKPVRRASLFDCLARFTGAPARARLAVAERPAAARAGSRILVVEDNIVNQRVAVRMLEKLGYRADVAGNGREALDALKRIAYDLIFMDCQMPEMDGFEASRAIRAREAQAGAAAPLTRVPIIAMTANALQGDRERCLVAGMDDYLAKPVTGEALARMLNTWLAGEPGSAHPPRDS